MARKLQISKVLKIAAGSMAAIVIAGWLQLSYVTSAGVVMLLSTQNAKRETMLVMLKRVAAFVIALLIAYTAFSVLGFYPLAPGVFLVFFMGICHLCSFQDVIAIDTVLVTHFYAEQSTSWMRVQNETLLLLTGAGTGVLMNLYIPDNSRAIRKTQMEIDGAIKGILGRMFSIVLQGSKVHYDGKYFLKLEELLHHAYGEAVANRDNRLLTGTRYCLNYMNVRTAQSHILKRIYENICLLSAVPSQACVVSTFIGKIFSSFRKSNNAGSLLKQLEKLESEMKEGALPMTREESENWAVLYQILYDLEEFLMEKRRSVEALTEREEQLYWEN